MREPQQGCAEARHCFAYGIAGESGRRRAIGTPELPKTTTASYFLSERMNATVSLT